jgi:NAD(P)-dependent dehydrogenase (short-subunit alcohol dehydrogenase family)
VQILGKTALITGGAGGIGKALARRLLHGGARVILWDLDGDALEASRRELSASGEVRTYLLDVSDPRQVAEAAEKVRQEIGGVDLLDNNAGVVFGGDFLSCSEEKLVKTFEVNLFSALWCTRAFLPGMIQKGRGHIVMMASAAGLLGVPGMAAYSASKHAVIGFTESLRLELLKGGHRGVTFTIATPSFVKTGMFDGIKPPLLTPWLEPEKLAQKIHRAVLKDQLYLREPPMVKALPALKGLASPRILDWLGARLGLHQAMDHWKGRDLS